MRRLSEDLKKLDTNGVWSVDCDDLEGTPRLKFGYDEYEQDGETGE